jgi:tetratricopeptide (TPR) repeat protein
MPYYWRSLGAIELASGRPDSAVVYFGKSASQNWPFNFADRFLLGRAYLEADRFDDAVKELTWCTKRLSYDSAYVSPWWARAHYLLGRAYESSGSTDEAAEHYREFLRIWEQADPGLPSVIDARERLVRL